MDEEELAISEADREYAYSLLHRAIRHLEDVLSTDELCGQHLQDYTHVVVSAAEKFIDEMSDYGVHG